MSTNKRNILLIEPNYKNKYPPLGLMKIATYHRTQGDHVEFVKGESHIHREKEWDRIYITTLFTFHWNITVRTIRYYSKSVKDSKNLYIGGILATLMADELLSELQPIINPTIIKGLIDKPEMLDKGNKKIVETMIPNYSILNTIDYKYGMADGYLAYSTRGCVNNCAFCAVKRLEPTIKYYCQKHTSISNLVKSIDEIYGEKKDLLLLDNNILASKDFDTIIADIINAGFEKGAKLNKKIRKLDFNQGLDARLINEKKMKLLAKTAIDPVRFAFDDSKMKDEYEKAVRLACKYGLKRQSTYVLYNFKDTPEDFYIRLKFNIELNEELDAKISSFPMKYIPLNAKNRKHVSNHWHRKLIRGVQCILLATKGIVSPNPVFFKAAFGNNPTEFRQICMMPERYIIWRKKNADQAAEWLKLYNKLGNNQMETLLGILAKGKIKQDDVDKENGRLKQLMEHYIENE